MSVHFTAPEGIAGKSVYESEGLLIRMANPGTGDDAQPMQPRLRAAIVVENKRRQWAWIDAKRSALVDPQHGATNLLFTDQIVPPGCWTRIGEIGATFVTFNLNLKANLFGSEPPRRPPPVAGTQRLLLTVTWDDGRPEVVDVSYEVVVTSPAKP